MRPHQELSHTFRRPISPGSCREGTSMGGAFWIGPLGQPDQRRDNWLSQPSDRHSMGANLSFVDGHVAYQRWRWPKQIIGPVNQPVENSEDLKDLRWLQAGLPEP